MADKPRLPEKFRLERSPFLQPITARIEAAELLQRELLRSSERGALNLGHGLDVAINGVPVRFSTGFEAGPDANEIITVDVGDPAQMRLIYSPSQLSDLPGQFMDGVEEAVREVAEHHQDTPGPRTAGAEQRIDLSGDDRDDNFDLVELTEEDLAALAQAYLGVHRESRGFRDHPSWVTLTRVCDGMLAASKAGLGRFREDVRSLDPLQVMWLRGCELISHHSKILMDRIPERGQGQSMGWHALRLLHHAAEQTIAHMRGLLPADQRPPVGTYDNSVTIATGVATPPAASTSATNPPAAAAADPALKRNVAVAMQALPTNLSWRTNQQRTPTQPQSPGGGRAPAAAKPQQHEAGR